MRSPRAPDALFDALHREIPWEQHRLRLFGREIGSPRLSCWIGDEGTAYKYSGTRFEPHAWTPTLALLREELAARFDLRFNSVLANLYRDGRDSMGWHSDDEPELGTAPVIASLSFGAVRRFRFRSRQSEARRARDRSRVGESARDAWRDAAPLSARFAEDLRGRMRGSI